LGQRPAEEIPKLDRGSHVLFAADLHPACPNAVLEAMACGLPVVSFNTGALPELVQGDSGCIVDYGGDPWELDPPNTEALTKGTMDILQDQARFRSAARDRAEKHFGLERMVDEYLDLLGWN
jgi:glycosyltransferase involved in cell wall biosynthesis